MGFKDSEKIYLDTANANFKTPGLDYARWTLKAPVMVYNANYKFKVKLNSLVLPLTYERISAERKNNKMVIAYGVDDFDLRDVLELGWYFTVEIDTPFIGVDEDYLIQHINEKISEGFQKTTAFATSEYGPYILNSERTTKDGTIYAPGKLMFATFHYRNKWQHRTVNGEPAPPLNENELPANTTIEKYGFKVICKSDLAGPARGFVSEDDIGLNKVLGIPDNYNLPVFGHEYNDPLGFVTDKSEYYKEPPPPKDPPVENDPDVPIVLGVARLPHGVDHLGTPYIKVMTNLDCTAIDPLSLTETKILSLVQITEGYDPLKPVKDVTTETHDQTYHTLGQSKIDTIELYLLDNKDRPLKPNGDWLAELVLIQEEPEKIDMYRGTQDFVGPVIDFHSSGDPGRYQKLQNEIQRAHWDTMFMESEHRNDQAHKIRRLF